MFLERTEPLDLFPRYFACRWDSVEKGQRVTDEGVGLLEPEDGRGQEAEVDSEGAAGGDWR